MSEYVTGDVMNSKNRNIELGEESDVLCPTCGAQSKQKLRIRSTVGETQELECMNCGYSDFKPVA